MIIINPSTVVSSSLADVLQAESLIAGNGGRESDLIMDKVMRRRRLRLARQSNNGKVVRNVNL